jgi:hypothetical protein
MTLPKDLYLAYKNVSQCSLISKSIITADSIQEFQDALNKAQTDETKELRNFTRSLYYSNKIGFMRYIGDKRNRVDSLVLWTESKTIIKHFNLFGKVYISFNDETNLYSVESFDENKKVKDNDNVDDNFNDNVDDNKRYNNKHYSNKNSNNEHYNNNKNSNNEYKREIKPRNNIQENKPKQKETWADVAESDDVENLKDELAKLKEKVKMINEKLTKDMDKC